MDKTSTVKTTIIWFRSQRPFIHSLQITTKNTGTVIDIKHIYHHLICKWSMGDIFHISWLKIQDALFWFHYNAVIYNDRHEVSNKTNQSSAPLAFVREIHRWPMDSPQKGPVTWKMFPFDDVIMFHQSMMSSSKFKFLTVSQWCYCLKTNKWKCYF